VKIPKPEVGLIINYSYLWHREAQTGQEEGRKDRPSAIVAATKDNRVIVVPITHTRPQSKSEGIEIPSPLKKQLGLDAEKAWVVTTELNTFEWPGMDLRPIGRKKSDSIVYGRLPHGFMKQVVGDVREKIQKSKARSVKRDEPIKKKDWSRKSEIKKPTVIKKAPAFNHDKDRSR
jgi:uncharacterized protein YifN (PemK superfamily)